MTEAEVIESMVLLGDGAVNIFTVFISVTFGYLTVAYFVGRDLTQFQLYAVTGLYLVTSITLGRPASQVSWLGKSWRISIRR